MARTRMAVEVNTDPVPGSFHTPKQARATVERILRGQIEHYDPRVLETPVLLAPVPDPEADQGEYDDEFPDKHSHTPENLGIESRGQHARLGMHVAEDEGRHYYLTLTATDEHVVVEVLDRYGEETLATFARTWEELLALVFANA